MSDSQGSFDDKAEIGSTEKIHTTDKARMTSFSDETFQSCMKFTFVIHSYIQERFIEHLHAMPETWGCSNEQNKVPASIELAFGEGVQVKTSK